VAVSIPARRPVSAIAKSWMGWLDAGVLAFVIAALVAELSLLFCTTLLRAFWNISFSWTDSVAHLSLSIMGFLGGALAFRHGQFVAVRIVIDRLPPTYQIALSDIVDALMVVVAGAATFLSARVAANAAGRFDPDLGWPASVLVVPLVLGCAVLTMYAIERLVSSSRLKVRAGIGAVLVAVVVIGWLTQQTWVNLFTATYIFWLALVLGFTLLLSGLPIAFALMAIPLAYLGITGAAPAAAVPQLMHDQTSSFVLLTIPMFVLAGLIMAEGGLGDSLAGFVLAVVGRGRAGLLHAVVVFMYLFSGLAGSKTADMAAVGTTMTKALRAEGHDATETAGVLGASAVSSGPQSWRQDPQTLRSVS
jgi:TRAP-type C4-dicarboxylate transport system permease small subunit